MALYTSIRFHPYSHEKRTRCLMPGSTLCAEIYPAKLVISDLATDTPQLIQEHIFSEFGPFTNFSVVSDLEKGEIVVSGQASCGYVRYRLFALACPKSYCLEFRKSPVKIEPVVVGNQSAQKVLFPTRERLFLGVDKAQEWSQVQRRGEIREILPVWYWLSQSISLSFESPSFISKARSLLTEANEHRSPDSLNALFMTGFSDLLVPRLEDSDFQGYHLPVTSWEKTSALHLLKESFSLIRQLFFQEDENTMQILPHLPPSFVSGTLTHLTTKKGHTVSLEWSKQFIRRMLVQAACDDEITLTFQKELKEYRLGKYHMDNAAKVHLQAGQNYLFDNFRK